MKNLLHLAAHADRDDLIRCLQYVLSENEIMRSRFGSHVKLALGEKRRLARAAQAMGKRWNMLISVATPDTLQRWRRQMESQQGTRVGKTGRPRTREEIVALILRMAGENDWGITRIYGELGKLGLAGRISRSTVANILRTQGFDPAPRMGPGTWDDFIQRHRHGLWAIDFLTKPLVTPSGRQDAYVLLFKQIGSKRVYLSPATCHPNRFWVEQQARNFVMFLQEQNLTATHVISDRDPKFTHAFRDILVTEGITTVRIAPYTPQMNGFAESFVGTIKRECLDHFITSTLDQLDHLVTTYCRFYNTVRPHRGLDNKPIGLPAPAEYIHAFDHADVECDSWLDGLLQHYRWKAAA